MPNHSMHAVDMKAQRRKFKRTANACISCRHSKIKCSGEEPCRNCTRRGVPCRFSTVSEKVAVSKRYLEYLESLQDGENAARRLRHTNAGSTGSDSSTRHLFEDQAGDTQHLLDQAVDDDTPLAPHTALETMPDAAAALPPAESWTSPFTTPSTIIQMPYKNKPSWIWIAPSSTWSFTVRLSVLMTQKLRLEFHQPPDSAGGDAPRQLPDFSREIYPLRWEPCDLDTAPDTSGLPSLDHALYHFVTTQFHLGHVYRFVDRDAFTQRLRAFYKGEALEPGLLEDRLWFTQLLLVLAFGSAYTAPLSGSLSGSSPDNASPPGGAYFLRALSLIPDVARLWRAGLPAIEVLTLAALYFHAADHREAAHGYITQAIHIAQMNGLHTALPEDQLGARALQSYRTLWWTVCHLNRRFSASVGIPVTIQSDEGTLAALLQSMDDAGDALAGEATLQLQAKMSLLMSYILTTIYKTENTHSADFLDKTRSVLRILAGYAHEIDALMQPALPASPHAVSKGARHGALLYHECVMYATRPLLLSVLQERLDAPVRADFYSDHDLVVRPLIAASTQSAETTLRILAEDCNLDAFLPFDLEFLYCAALHLTIAHALFPGETGETGDEDSADHSGQLQDRELAHTVLNNMVGRGSRLADMRRQELTYLEQLFQELSSVLSPRGEKTSPPLPSPSDSGQFELDVDAETTVEGMETMEHHFTISSHDFLSLMDQVGVDMDEEHPPDI